MFISIEICKKYHKIISNNVIDLIVRLRLKLWYMHNCLNNSLNDILWHHECRRNWGYNLMQVTWYFCLYSLATVVYYVSDIRLILQRHYTDHYIINKVRHMQLASCITCCAANFTPSEHAENKRHVSGLAWAIVLHLNMRTELTHRY